MFVFAFVFVFVVVVVVVFVVVTEPFVTILGSVSFERKLPERFRVLLWAGTGAADSLGAVLVFVFVLVFVLGLAIEERSRELFQYDSLVTRRNGGGAKGSALSVFFLSLS